MKTILSLSEFYNVTLLHVKDFFEPSFFEGFPHSHEQCEIFVQLEGSMDILVEKQTYCCEKNQVRIYASQELHYGKINTAQPMEWFQISLPLPFFQVAENHCFSPMFFEKPLGEHNVFTSKKQQQIVALLREILREHESGSPFWKQYFISNILKMLCILAEQSNNIYHPFSADRTVQDLLSIINSGNVKTAEDLCRQSNYSSSYVHRIFRDRLHTTPHKFIMGKRLNDAKIALCQGLSISEVCEMTGFANDSHFITLFKKTFGMTPKKYQQSQLNLSS